MSRRRMILSRCNLLLGLRFSKYFPPKQVENRFVYYLCNRRESIADEMLRKVRSAVKARPRGRLLGYLAPAKFVRARGAQKLVDPQWFS
jgi:hypothetical protein